MPILWAENGRKTGNEERGEGGKGKLQERLGGSSGGLWRTKMDLIDDDNDVKKASRNSVRPSLTVALGE